MNRFGVTIIEMLAVIIITSIVSLIAVPTIGDLIENTKLNVCEENAVLITEQYQLFLDIENLMHSETVFSQFVNERYANIDIGIYDYIDNSVICLISPDLKEAPYL